MYIVSFSLFLLFLLSVSFSFSYSCCLSQSLVLYFSVFLSFFLSVSFSRTLFVFYFSFIFFSPLFSSLLYLLSYCKCRKTKKKKPSYSVLLNTLYPYINRRHWKGSSGTKEVILPHLIPSVQPLHNLKDVLYSPSLFLIVNLHSQCWKSNRSAKDAL